MRMSSALRSGVTASDRDTSSTSRICSRAFPVRERLRLRAEDVMPLNKRLIYASLTPYGEHGPERDRTAFDATAWWARSGLMDMVRATGDTELALSVPGMGDHPTAMAMYAAIVTALYRRQMTGEGGEVTTSLLANGLWSNGCQVQAALCDLELVPRAERGQRNPLVEFYLTADGREFTLAMVNTGPRVAAAWLERHRPARVAGRPAVRDPAGPVRERRPADHAAGGRSSGASPGSTGTRG